MTVVWIVATLLPSAVIVFLGSWLVVNPLGARPVPLAVRPRPELPCPVNPSEDGRTPPA